MRKCPAGEGRPDRTLAGAAGEDDDGSTDRHEDEQRVSDRAPAREQREVPGEWFVDEIGKLRADEQGERRSGCRVHVSMGAQIESIQKIPDGSVSPGPHGKGVVDGSDIGSERGLGSRPVWDR
jgi:hypothetical protein